MGLTKQDVVTARDRVMLWAGRCNGAGLWYEEDAEALDLVQDIFAYADEQISHSLGKKSLDKDGKE